jgi:hopene-associated glycosyltransferase HpnB
MLTAVAFLSLVIWFGLVFGRGGFWRLRERIDEGGPEPETWPGVTALVPARNEAAVIGRTLASLLDQDYPGPLRVILIDDHSEDGTAARAEAAAEALGANGRLTVLSARPLPPGWTGKLWALSEGVAEAARQPTPYLWFTDADIEHDKASLRRLVAKAEREGRGLVSLMVLLPVGDLWSKLLIPPFVFFFAKLFPPAFVNDPKSRVAAAAGGCVLLRREALEAAGGLAPMRGAIIDDCTLAAHIKGHGHAIWLGFTERLRAVRPYRGLTDIWAMVARSAYAQLRYSPLLLAGTLVGMGVIYLAPPLILLSAPWHTNLWAAGFATAAWGLMAAAFRPSGKLYHLPPLAALALPLAAILYSAMTLSSAVAHGRGRGGAWKGRLQARLDGAPLERVEGER